MKRIVLTFGLIAGGILSAMMFATIPFMDKIGNDRGEVIGYTTMVLAFLMVFFGIRTYRDTVGGGSIGFGRAFAVGIQITLIACVCYVASWEIIYYKMMPDFADKYAARVVEKTKASGATPVQVAETTRKMEEFKAMYKNPFINVAMTFVEPFPVGLLITLVCAGVLRRKRATAEADALLRIGAQ